MRKRGKRIQGNGGMPALVDKTSTTCANRNRKRVKMYMYYRGAIIMIVAMMSRFFCVFARGVHMHVLVWRHDRRQKKREDGRQSESAAHVAIIHVGQYLAK